MRTDSGLSARMRTDPAVRHQRQHSRFGGETYCATSFLYDARGGRASCALEVIDYRAPALRRDTSGDPVRPGIRSTLMTVADLHEAVAVLRAAGVTVGDPVDGLISESKAVSGGRPGRRGDRAGREYPRRRRCSWARCSPASGSPPSTLGATGEFLTAIGFRRGTAADVDDGRPVNSWRPADPPSAWNAPWRGTHSPRMEHQFVIDGGGASRDRRVRSGAVGRQPPGPLPMCAAGGERREGARSRCRIRLSGWAIRCGARCPVPRSRACTSRSCVHPTAWCSSSLNGR